MSIREEFERAFESELGLEFDAKYSVGRPSTIALWAAKWMAKHAEQMVLSELGHINNNQQRAYSWHEIQDFVVKMRYLAQELSR